MHTTARHAFAAATLALIVLLTGCGSDEPTDTADTITTTTIDPDRAPTEVRWEPYQGITLPIGADGPRQTSGGTATGFTQSPQGAALAAINHSVRIGVAPDSQ